MMISKRMDFVSVVRLWGVRAGCFAVCFACCAAAATGSAAAHDVSPIKKDDTFTSEDQQGLLLFSYALARIEFYPPDLVVAPVAADGTFGDDIKLRLQNRFGVWGTRTLSGERRYMKKAYSFFPRQTYYHALKLDPGVYVVTGTAFTRQTGDGDFIEEPTIPDRISWAFRIDAGAVNYIGDFNKGSRRGFLCAVTYGVYNANEGLAPTAGDEPCYQAIAGQYEAAEGEIDETTFPPDQRVRISGWSPGIDINNDFAAVKDEDRPAMARRFLEKYRPGVDLTTPVRVRRTVDQVLMKQPLAPQLAPLFGPAARDEPAGDGAASPNP